MGYRVSVRDTALLDNCLSTNQPINLPRECIHNSELLQKIIPFAKPLLPRIDALDEQTIKKIADGVAYLLRTDFIVAEGIWLPPFLAEPRRSLHGEDGVPHFLNKPDTIRSDWKLPEEYKDRGAAEFYRCYNGVLTELKEVRKVIASTTRDSGSSHCAAFSLANVTAFLLNPDDLVDYRYTTEERKEYEETLDSQMDSV